MRSSVIVFDVLKVEVVTIGMGLALVYQGLRWRTRSVVV